MSLKHELRKQMRAQRRAMPDAQHRRKSALAAAAIQRLPQFASGKRVAVYLAFDGETGTSALIRAARHRGLRLFVPVISDVRRRRMRFYPLGAKSRRGAYGIQVPHSLAAPIAPRWLNLIVVPLVGVDRVGRRLGMGAGFYDRALDFRRNVGRRGAGRLGPHLAGLAFDAQRTEVDFADIWDLQLDSLATESGLHRFPTMRASHE